MISLSMIVKADDEEAKLLDRCLSYVAHNVDELNITITGKNKACEKVCKKYGAKVSHFDWVNDFSKARNFNFSQSKEEFIFWCDADDIIKGAENLRGLAQKMKEENIDTCVMNYLYDFDENKNCTVKHLKTRIVKKGCVTWVGAVHEDFSSTRTITPFFTYEVEVLHFTDNKRAENSSRRNLEIALKQIEKNPKDPRSFWLVANAYWGERNYKKAIAYFEKFVKTSHSEEEKYLAYLNLATISSKEDYALFAIGLRPAYPNAYHKYAELISDKRPETAIQFVEIGLQLPIPDKEIIAFNPMDYDYNPLMLLVKCYWRLGKYTKVQTILDKMHKMFPKDKQVAQKRDLILFELKEITKAQEYLKQAKTIKDKEKLKAFLDALPERVKQHPAICSFRNTNFIKETSSGKDLIFYCSYTSKEWTPETALTKGVGGSEESVIHIARGLSRKGWNVTVYNNCGKDAGVYDGVNYRPFWEYNVRDKQDVTILWRHPRPADFKPNSTKVFVDLHDVVPEGELYAERLEHIDKIFVKTKAHRDLFPSVADEKFTIIPNGIDPSQFELEVEKDPYLILNTSSPDRHLKATLDVFEKLLEKNPKYKLAWYYGWDVFDEVHEKDEEVMGWKKEQLERFEKLKVEGKAEGGSMISHTEIAKKYLESSFYLYPTRFFEIHCISAVKAQLAGTVPITSDYGALAETVQYGKKIHEHVEKMGESIPELQGQNIDEYVEAILTEKEDPKMREWAKETYNWQAIVGMWDKTLQDS